MKGLLALLALTAAFIGQAGPPREVSAAPTANRVEGLSRKVTQLIAAGDLRAADAAIAAIHGDVDRYVTGSAIAGTPGSDLAHVESGLKRILRSAADMPPVALGSRSPKDNTVFVAYSLRKGSLMGDGATSVTLRAYRTNGNRVQLADVTGADMDGYTRLSVSELPSPTSGEAWFLISGNLTGTNGPNVRMRAYVYRSGRFRTAWMPANEWGDFTVQPTSNGFTVAGDYYRSDKKRRDVYALSGDGVVLVTPEH